MAYPAPARIAAPEDIRTEPVRPREPPAIVTWPELNLVERAPRRGANSSTPRVDRPRGRLGRRARRDPDRDHAELTAVPLPGGDPMSELGGMEADREIGLDRHALDLAAGGINPGGDVAGEDRRLAPVDRLDRRQGRFTRRAGEAGAEDRIDDRTRAGQGLHRGRPGPAAKISRASASKPSSRRCRAATKPSPPLLPLPQTIRTGPCGASAATASASAARRSPSTARRESRDPRSPSGRPRESPRRRTGAEARSPPPSA